MKIVTIDGKRTIEINHLDANLKMACDAELRGAAFEAAQHLIVALKSEESLDKVEK